MILQVGVTFQFDWDSWNTTWKGSMAIATPISLGKKSCPRKLIHPNLGVKPFPAIYFFIIRCTQMVFFSKGGLLWEISVNHHLKKNKSKPLDISIPGQSPNPAICTWTVSSFSNAFKQNGTVWKRYCFWRHGRVYTGAYGSESSLLLEFC